MGAIVEVEVDLHIARAAYKTGHHSNLNLATVSLGTVPKSHENRDILVSHARKHRRQGWDLGPWHGDRLWMIVVIKLILAVGWVLHREGVDR